MTPPPPPPSDAGSSELEPWLADDAWLRRVAASLARPGRSPADGDDIAQEAWLSALRHARGRSSAGGWPTIAAPRRWLAKIAGNVARQDQRAAVRRRDHELAAAGHAPAETGGDGRDTTTGALEAIERRRAVLDAVEALPAAVRDAVVLHHLEGHDVGTVASQLGVPKETVRTRLKRGRALLKERLAGAFGGGALSILLAWLALGARQSAHAFTRSAAPLVAMNAGTKTIVLPVGAGLALLAAAAWLGPVLQGRTGASSASIDRTQLATPIPADQAPKASTPDVDDARRTAAATRPRTTERASTAPEAVAQVTGYVVGLEGHAIAGAEVSSVDDDRRATTDANGRFQWPVQERGQRLRASLEGLTTLMHANVLPASQGNTARELTIVMAPSIRIAGLVECEDGTPAAGAKLRLQLDDPWARNVGRDLAGGSPRRIHLQADESGRFDARDLPAVEDTLIWVDHGAGTGLFRCPMATTLNLRFVVKAKRDHDYAMMSCRVVDPTGASVAAGTLCTEDWSRELSTDGAVDVPRAILTEIASFDLFVPGHLPARVRAPGAGEARAVAGPWSGAPALRRSTAWPEELTVELSLQKAPTVRGRVVSEAGAPLAKCPVWLLDPAEFREFADELLGPIAMKTNEEGRFEFAVLPDRTYGIAATNRASLRRGEALGIRAGDHAVEIVVATTEERGTVRGVCRAPDGTPLAGVTVHPLYATSLSSWASGGQRISAVTDADGRFSLDEVHVDITHLECEGRTTMPATVEVSPGEANDALTVTLARRAAVQFDASAIDQAYDWAALRPIDAFLPADADREDLTLLAVFQWIANGKLEGYNATYWAELSDGRSSVYTTYEGLYEAQLLADDHVIARQRVRLVAGEHAEVVFQR